MRCASSPLRAWSRCRLSQAGNGMENWKCIHPQTEENVYTVPSGRNKGRGICRTCHRRSNRKTDARRREQGPYHSYCLIRGRCRREGVAVPDEAQWKALWAKRILGKSVCQLCLKIVKALAIDHDHKTGRVRGLVCINCNVRAIPFIEGCAPGFEQRVRDYLKGV